MTNGLIVRAQVIGCRNCELVSGCSRPVPFDGPYPSDVAVVGEAPGRVEDQEGKPFVGPSGDVARSIVEPRLGSVPWLNVVSCWPHRTPTASEVVACSDNLHAQLRLIEPKFLLLFGGVAASAFVDGYRVGELRGRWFRTPVRGFDKQVFGLLTWHPAAVLRNRSLLVEVLDDLRVFRETAATDGSSIPPYVYYPCVKCGSVVGTHVTDEGIAWCQKHWQTRKGPRQELKLWQ